MAVCCRWNSFFRRTLKRWKGCSGDVPLVQTNTTLTMHVITDKRGRMAMTHDEITEASAAYFLNQNDYVPL